MGRRRNFFDWRPDEEGEELNAYREWEEGDEEEEEIRRKKKRQAERSRQLMLEKREKGERWE